MESVKNCTKCETEKCLDDFAKHSGRKDGRQAYCKKCQNEAHKKKYREDESYRQARLKGKNKARNLGRYKLSDDDYEHLGSLNNGLCHICGKKEFRVVDHDHSCCPGINTCGLCVRGLLCNNCNVTLGLVGDDIAHLESLIDYLRRFDRVAR